MQFALLEEEEEGGRRRKKEEEINLKIQISNQEVSQINCIAFASV